MRRHRDHLTLLQEPRSCAGFTRNARIAFDVAVVDGDVVAEVVVVTERAEAGGSGPVDLPRGTPVRGAPSGRRPRPPPRPTHAIATGTRAERAGVKKRGAPRYRRRTAQPTATARPAMSATTGSVPHPGGPVAEVRERGRAAMLPPYALPASRIPTRPPSEAAGWRPRDSESGTVREQPIPQLDGQRRVGREDGFSASSARTPSQRDAASIPSGVSRCGLRPWIQPSERDCADDHDAARVELPGRGGRAQPGSQTRRG